MKSIVTLVFIIALATTFIRCGDDSVNTEDSDYLKVSYRYIIFPEEKNN